MFRTIRMLSLAPATGLLALVALSAPAGPRSTQAGAEGVRQQAEVAHFRAGERREAAALRAQRGGSDPASVGEAAVAAGEPGEVVQVVSVSSSQGAAAATAAGGSIQQVIASAFAPYGAAAVAWGLETARCESTLDPRASNGVDVGLFQFLPSTFASDARRAGLPYTAADIFDPAANAAVAAWKYAHDGPSGWPVCGYR